MKAGTILLRDDGFMYMVVPTEEDEDTHKIMCLNNLKNSTNPRVTKPIDLDTFSYGNPTFAEIGEIDWNDIAKNIDKTSLVFELLNNKDIQP